ncbi:hypothetical protein GCK32_019732, partial [Trichostrongylus colubriformis]
ISYEKNQEGQKESKDKVVQRYRAERYSTPTTLPEHQDVRPTIWYHRRRGVRTRSLCLYRELLSTLDM